MEEIWKPVVGYEGFYEVSNLGRVKSLHCNPAKIIAQTGRPNHYLSVHLSKNGKATRKNVHRLVAMAFVSNPSNKLQVNHINGNRADNRAENLEWVTGSENIKHSFYRLGREIPLHPKRPVLCVETGEVFRSVGEASRAKGVNAGYICQVALCRVNTRANGSKYRCLTAGGYHWKYL